jgi:hypothetical protein
MCGWPPARKGRDCAEAGGLLAVMCQASLCGSLTAGPDGCSRAGTSSNPRV